MLVTNMLQPEMRYSYTPLVMTIAKLCVQSCCPCQSPSEALRSIECIIECVIISTNLQSKHIPHL